MLLVPALNCLDANVNLVAGFFFVLLLLLPPLEPHELLQLGTTMGATESKINIVESSLYSQLTQFHAMRKAQIAANHL